VEQAVSIVATAATPTAVIRQQTTWERFPTLWRELLDEVWAHVRAGDVRAGHNVMLYLDDTPTVEVGVELEGPFTPSARVIASTLPEGSAATTVVRGAPSPEGIAAGHDAVVAWCRANGHELTGTRWEVYGHWRDDDPDGFETTVCWLLAS
jgi:effector-binding domain-containing protein